MGVSVTGDLWPAGAELARVRATEVPWHYGDPVKEYEAVREGVALLDESSIGLIEVAGRDAVDLLQRCFAKDVEFLSPERLVTGLLLADDGRPVDIITVSRLDDGFLVETSFGNGDITRQHLQERAEGDVRLQDLGSERTIVAIEGPESWEVAESVLGPQISGLPFQGVHPMAYNNEEIVVSRAGFTSEFGLQVRCSHVVARRLWGRFADIATPAGFQALETAMLEVRQPLVHREILAEDSVASCGLNWLVDMDKPEFIGREQAAYAAQRTRTLPVTVVGAGIDGSLPAAAAVSLGGEEIGHLVWALPSPALGAGIGVARVQAGWAASGLELEAVIAGRIHSLRTVSSPARIPTSWGRLAF